MQVTFELCRSSLRFRLAWVKIGQLIVSNPAILGCTNRSLPLARWLINDGDSANYVYVETWFPAFKAIVCANTFGRTTRYYKGWIDRESTGLCRRKATKLQHVAQHVAAFQEREPVIQDNRSTCGRNFWTTSSHHVVHLSQAFGHRCASGARMACRSKNRSLASWYLLILVDGLPELHFPRVRSSHPLNMSFVWACGGKM